jgi:hypothetical protein
MRLFNMDDQTFSLDFEPEVLTIREFNKIITRDKAAGKPVAISELSYIWFFCDYKSDFVQIIDEDERSQEIITSLISLPPKWKPDKVVLAGMERYRLLSRTITTRMLEDTRCVLDNMSKWARDASLKLGDVDAGAITIGKIQSFIAALPKLLDTLNSLEERVLRGRDVSDTHRGNQEKSMFEDEID